MVQTLARSVSVVGWLGPTLHVCRLANLERKEESVSGQTLRCDVIRLAVLVLLSVFCLVGHIH